MDAIESAREKFDRVKEAYNIDFTVKDEQIQVALSAMNGKDVLALLPTGFGKTLCFVLPTILSEDHESTMTLIISPLTSLIEDHITSLQNLNLTCAKITSVGEMDKGEIEGITRGKCSFVFSSPESVLKPRWRTMFLSDVWQAKLKLIAVDEAHCVSEWGDSFRKDYQRLHELRTFLMPL